MPSRLPAVHIYGRFVKGRAEAQAAIREELGKANASLREINAKLDE